MPVAEKEFVDSSWCLSGESFQRGRCRMRWPRAENTHSISFVKVNAREVDIPLRNTQLGQSIVENDLFVMNGGQNTRFDELNNLLHACHRLILSALLS